MRSETLLPEGKRYNRLLEELLNAMDFAPNKDMR